LLRRDGKHQPISVKKVALGLLENCALLICRRSNADQ
jgi:hypothetical protein